jgi:hypothetical protein
MQQPLSLPDDTEDAQQLEPLDTTDPPTASPLPFPGGNTLDDHVEIGEPTVDSTANSTVSERELLLAQHRRRMREQAGEESPTDPADLNDGDLAFPGAQPADKPGGAVSQREAIMQQQRDIVLRQAGVKPGQAASPGPKRPTQPARAARSGWLTLRSAWAALIIGLTTLIISGSVATGQTGPLNQVAGAVTPDVVERWIGEHITSFGDTTDIPAATTEAPANVASLASQAADSPAPAGPARTEATPQTAQTLRAQISNTNGAGVSVRALCIREARTPNTLDEGVAVRIIGRGVGDCSGWSVVRAGASTSWVEDRFLGPAATR